MVKKRIILKIYIAGILSFHYIYLQDYNRSSHYLMGKSRNILREAEMNAFEITEKKGELLAGSGLISPRSMPGRAIIRLTKETSRR
jgi:hypothetical protein